MSQTGPDGGHHQTRQPDTDTLIAVKSTACSSGGWRGPSRTEEPRHDIEMPALTVLGDRTNQPTNLELLSAAAAAASTRSVMTVKLGY